MAFIVEASQMTIKIILYRHYLVSYGKAKFFIIFGRIVQFNYGNLSAVYLPQSKNQEYVCLSVHSPAKGT